jgi:hypothetical protein
MTFDLTPYSRSRRPSFRSLIGFALVGEFSDPGVSGADPIEVRPGFSALLDRIEEERRPNGRRVQWRQLRAGGAGEPKRSLDNIILAV